MRLISSSCICPPRNTSITRLRVAVLKFGGHKPSTVSTSILARLLPSRLNRIGEENACLARAVSLAAPNLIGAVRVLAELEVELVVLDLTLVVALGIIGVSSILASIPASSCSRAVILASMLIVLPLLTSVNVACCKSTARDSPSSRACPSSRLCPCPSVFPFTRQRNEGWASLISPSRINGKNPKVESLREIPPRGEMPPRGEVPRRSETALLWCRLK